MTKFTIFAQTHQQVIELFLNDLRRRKLDYECLLRDGLPAQEALRIARVIGELDSLITQWMATEVQTIGGRRRGA